MEKHGMSFTRTYSSWACMKTRCSPSCPRKIWHNYYGRGIRVCDEWRNSFKAFLRDMGESPPGMQLERIDNNKGYSKNNCVWATRKQQSNNTRNTKVLEFRGKKMPLMYWSEITGLHQQTLRYRIFKLGWSMERAITTPARRRSDRPERLFQSAA